MKLKLSKKLVIMAAGVVALLGGLGVGGYYLFFFDGEQAAAAPPPPPPPPEPGVVELEPFLTNLAPGGGHKARLQVTLAIAPKEVAEAVAADPLLTARIRDQILSKLGSSSYEELSEAAGKQRLRREIERAADALLEDGEVREALFVDFVLQ